MPQSTTMKMTTGSDILTIIQEELLHSEAQNV